jgi:hypothetical protein
MLFMFYSLRRLKGEWTMESGHFHALESKHAELERMIQAEATRPKPDNVMLSDLKKQKLRLKEAMQTH